MKSKRNIGESTRQVIATAGQSAASPGESSLRWDLRASVPGSLGEFHSFAKNQTASLPGVTGEA